MPSTRVTNLWVGPTPPPELGPGTVWLKTIGDGRITITAHEDDIAEWSR
ncbi:hypothetical protein [Rathayibacter caricis]|nr:hypothetical protein [Rathayibacter caricis]